MTTSNTKRPCSQRQALPETGALPNGHTNRSTESCGTSVVTTAPPNLAVGRFSFSISGKRFKRSVLPRDREVERRRFAAGEFVCLEERPLGVSRCALGERFVRLDPYSEQQTEWSLAPCR